MPNIVRWDPFAELEEMRHRMDRIFSDFRDGLIATPQLDLGSLLAELASDEDAEVQEAAIAALGQIGGPASKSVLQSLATEHDDERVLDAVAEALATADFLDDPMAFKLYLDRNAADDGEEGEDEE